MDTGIKREYNKENVIAMLKRKEKYFSEKAVENFNKKEHTAYKRYADLKNAMQNLILEFEEQFE